MIDQPASLGSSSSIATAGTRRMLITLALPVLTEQLLNAFVGMCLLTQWRKVHEDQRRTTGALLGVQVVLFAVLALLLRSAGDVNELFLKLYLGL